MLFLKFAHHGPVKLSNWSPIFSLRDCFISFRNTYKGDGRRSLYLKCSKDFFPANRCGFVRPFSSSLTSNSEVGDKNQQDSSLDIDIKAIAQSDPELEKKLKILILEHEIFKQDGFKVPSRIRNDQWKELLQMPTRSRRKKYLSFLFGIEKKKENKKRKKEEKKIEKEDMDSSYGRESDHMKYGFHGSTIFVRVYDTTINNLYNYNALRAMMFGQKLVFDCSYDRHMTTRESKNCAKQLMITFAQNRLHADPFNLYFTGALRNSPTMENLHKFIPTLYDDTFPLNISEKSYLELFPKENLVYLTPHCREELLEYDHDAIYIVGAMVDKVHNEPLSLAKAKREGLKMAKLPIDRYLDWGSGSGKCLTLNHMLNILLDQKVTGDWNQSLRHVPRRKLVRENVEQEPKFHNRFVKRGFSVKSLF